MCVVVAIVEIRLSSSFGLQHEHASFSSNISRSNFLATAVGGLVAGAPAAWARENDPLKGTKKDPAFETCLSLCMYECTKPKGSEQKSRAECLPECKGKCATSKAQLLKGEPIKPTQ